MQKIIIGGARLSRRRRRRCRRRCRRRNTFFKTFFFTNESFFSSFLAVNLNIFFTQNLGSITYLGPARRKVKSTNAT